MQKQSPGYSQKGGAGVGHGLVRVVELAQAAAAAHVLDAPIARHGQLANELAGGQ